MQGVADALWNAFGGDMSWMGFYIDQPNAPDEQRMTLGPCRDTPACSPIGLHGVCGKALLTQQVQIIRDVADLGENYIACDPRDRSEIVIPLLDECGRCDAVLDVDSWEVGAFDHTDARALEDVLRRAALSTGTSID